MNIIAIAISISSIVLLASIYTFILWPPISPNDERLVVIGYYGLGVAGLMLMFNSVRHLKNPEPKPRKAYVTLFVGFVLVFTSYFMLEYMLGQTRII